MVFGLGGKDILVETGLRIGFTGKAGSGKTTAARLVCEGRTPSGVVSFADPIKQICVLMYNLNPALPMMKAHLRPIMQEIGSKMREVDKDIFVNYAITMIQAASPTSTIAVDDVRFPNEVAALRKHGFIIVKLVRDVALLTGTEAEHKSETELEEIVADYTIKANNLKELRDGLVEVVKKLGGKELKE